ncbi:MAG: nucleotide exchange factor GrpE [Selenomonas sp.]|jgi:molecular chaperone GrpE|nr:nucleotide exchange factor GrpE [Selenomonas sp.]MDD7056864.1 nucleotide exchange factor GrpE [Selenomonadaceae bacterium]HBT79738.1 nucleotide exchange factor GrpE [Selenomonas sp.]
MQEEIKDAANEAAAETDAAETQAEGSENAAQDAQAEAPEDDAAKAEKLQQALDEAKQQALRLQADFANFRKRSNKEREELSNVITQDILKDMLPILDNFERAMAAETKDVEAFQKGVEMIFTQFQETLKKDGLEYIETAGKKFDPNFHQAVMRVQNPDLEDDAIAQELQKGYMVKGRVIRPSMVQVVAN